jgi:fructose 5-dehydrogenase small subunit
MSVRLSLTRRRVLIGLTGIAPAVRFLSPASAWAAGDDDSFLQTSRIITGNDSLSADISQRIHSLLVERIDQFSSQLVDLAGAMKKVVGGRTEMIGALDDHQVKFAIEIAKPWYLGYVGTPSNFVLKDNAAFTTYLQAQSWQKIVDEVPRPTYPNGNAGWWVAAPPGIDAPAMPGGIANWTFHPGGPSQILAPDPEWKTYASAKHPSIEDARRAKPGTGNTAESK